MVSTFCTIWINRVRLSILLVVSLTGKMCFSLSSPLAPDKPRFARSAPRQPAQICSLIPVVLTHAIPLACRDSVNIYIYIYIIQSGQSRVYRVTQLLRTDGVPRRDSAGTGPVALKVVPVTGVVFVGFYALLFFNAHYYLYEVET